MSIIKFSCLIFAIIFAANSFASTTVTCSKKDQVGIPVLLLQIDKEKILSAQEILLSQLTGALVTGKKLSKIPSAEVGVVLFDLGQRYTEDLSLAVSISAGKITAKVESYDRDDASGSSEELICR